MHSQVHAALTAAAREVVEALGAAFVEGNRPFSAEAPGPWIRAVYSPQAADNSALGGRRIRVDAVAGFEVYTAAGTGDAEGLRLCDSLLEALDNRHLSTAGPEPVDVYLSAGVVTRPGLDSSAPQWLRHDCGFPLRWQRRPARAT